MEFDNLKSELQAIIDSALNYAKNESLGYVGIYKQMISAYGIKSFLFWW